MVFVRRLLQSVRTFNIHGIGLSVKVDTKMANKRPIIAGERIRDPFNINEEDTEIQSSNKSDTLLLGPGLMQEGDELVALTSGYLCTQPPNKLWIDSYQKRYVPACGDSVIGVITGKTSEFFKVDIGSANAAILPWLSFEGATKRNRPNIKIGQLVYAQVCLADKDMEPELTCISPQTNRADGFGEIKGGSVLKCSLPLARALIRQEVKVMPELAKFIAFEAAIGLNGRVWINSSSVEKTIAVMDVLKRAEGMFNATAQELKAMVMARVAVKYE